jgi:aminoglycoside 6'-N-acetyltransferase I
MTFSVRRIDQAEALGGANIIIQAYAEPPWEEAWTMENARKRLVELSSALDAIMLGAFYQERLVGFVFASPHTSAIGTGLYVAEIAISPSYQRMGFGTALLTDVERTAIQRGYPQVWLVSRQIGGVADYYKTNGYSRSNALCVYSKMLGATVLQDM